MPTLLNPYRHTALLAPDDAFDAAAGPPAANMWSYGKDADAQSSVALNGTGALVLTSGNVGGFTDYAWIQSRTTPLGTVDYQARCTFDATAEWSYFGARTTAAAGLLIPANGYVFEFQGGVVRVHRIVAGVFTQLGASATAVVAGTTQWVRWQVKTVGSTVECKLKIWTGDSILGEIEEPEAWTISRTDSSGSRITTDGYLLMDQLGGTSAASRTLTVDKVQRALEAVDTILPPLTTADVAGYTTISTAQNPMTVIGANPGGNFLIQAGTHNNRSFDWGAGSTYNGTTIVCEPGVIFEGNNANLRFMQGNADGITFRGWDLANQVVIRNYKVTGVQTTAFNMGNNDDSRYLADHWKVGFVKLEGSGRVGMRPGNHAYLAWSTITTSTELGMGGGGFSSSGDRTHIYRCKITMNNTSNADPGFEGGETKFVGTWFRISHSIVSNNPVHASSTDGYGLWLDVMAEEFEIDHNIVRDIQRAGIPIEICGRGSIHDNLIERVGYRWSAAFLNLWGSSFGAGIQIASSGHGPLGDGIDIYGNRLTDCYEGIIVYDSRRGTWEAPNNLFERFSQDIQVYDNLLTRCGPSGVIMDIFPAWASGQAYKLVDRDNVGYTTATDPVRSTATYITFSDRIYRALTNHTSSVANQPTGTASDNANWRYVAPHGTIGALTGLRDLDWLRNVYVDSGSSDNHVPNAGNFHRTGTSFPGWTQWQAWGQDATGSFTGTPGYVGA